MLLILVIFPLPEALLAVARSVIIGWAGSITLLSFLGTTERDLNECRNQEEESGKKISKKLMWLNLGLPTLQ